ncbi:helix-turn-helix domain-containing protein [Maritalea sp.]|jgi:predicted transcriptional regulator/transcriptional regulator with XRE-family HTH domain|uniref:helix-turn-helix domain-containing protein n=1 Tax=Maritalea sp. TaxID=2003361 RepID=UPI0039E421E2
MRSPIGLKIRNLRKTLHFSQSGFAKMVGISPSYLNLIEANKRDVGGTLLQRIAALLNVELEVLTGDREQRLINDLEEVFADPMLESLSLGPEDARNLVATNPDAGAALFRIYRGFLDARAEARAMSNRLRSDPLFSELLHQMLSQITAVRSAAEILVDVPDLEGGQRKRFHASLSRDSRTLSDVAQTLIGEFERETVEHHSVSPMREVDDLIIDERNHFASLEELGISLRNEVLAFGGYAEASLDLALKHKFGVTVERAGQVQAQTDELPGQYRYNKEQKLMWFQGNCTMSTRQFQLSRLYAELSGLELLMQLTDDKRLTSANSRRLAYRALGSYLAGAISLPYADFLRDAIESKYDIDFLSQKYTASFEQVAHRLVTLRAPGHEGIPFGFLRSDPAGRLTKQFPLPGLQLPNAGHACPLWAIYGAFRRPNDVVRQVVTYPDGSRYLFFAKSTSKRAAAYSQAPFYTSVMLACDILYADKTVYGEGLQLENAALDVPVGPTCHMCIRRDCEHRQEEVLASVDSMHSVRTPLVSTKFDVGDADKNA